MKLNYGGQFFKSVSVKTDYYVLQNCDNQNSMKTIDYYIGKTNYIDKFYLAPNLQFIPNMFNGYINSILQKVSTIGKSYECILSSDCHKTRSHVKQAQDETYKFPLYNTSGNPFSYFSSRDHKYQAKKKVIMSNSGKLAPFYDNGVYGTTQDSMIILVESEKEGKIIVQTLCSKLFTFLIKICQWGNFRNEAKLFSFFKYPDSNTVIYNNIDDRFIYEYYQITKDEINLI